MIKGYCCSQRDMGVGRAPARYTRQYPEATAKIFASNPLLTWTTVAPNIFLMLISFVRCSAKEEGHAKDPQTADEDGKDGARTGLQLT